MLRRLAFALVAAFVSVSPSLAGSATCRAGAIITGATIVIDGDTFEVAGRRVRLQGVAAPERDEPGGAAATRFMRAATNDATMRCQLDGTKTHGRCVAVCMLPDGRDVGRAAIAAGVARDCPHFSGGRYADAERAARTRTPKPVT